MSQIDKLNYVPLLFWFLIFFVFLYFYLVSYILPFIFGALRTRVFFFNYLVDELLYGVFFSYSVKFFFSNSSHYSIVNFVLGFLSSWFFLEFLLQRHYYLLDFFPSLEDFF